MVNPVFFNTAHASLSGLYMNYAKSIGGGTSCTRILEGVIDIESKIKLIDSYGIQEELKNYEKILDKILSGNITTGYDELDQTSLQSSWIENPTINDKIHGIFIVYDPAAVEVNEDITILIELMKKIDSNIPFRLVIPKIDIWDPLLIDNPLLIDSSKIISDKIDMFSFYRQKDQIFPLFSCLDEKGFTDGISHRFLTLFKSFLKSDIQAYFTKVSQSNIKNKKVGSPSIETSITNSTSGGDKLPCVNVECKKLFKTFIENCPFCGLLNQNLNIVCKQCKKMYPKGLRACDDCGEINDSYFVKCEKCKLVYPKERFSCEECGLTNNNRAK